MNAEKQHRNNKIITWIVSMTLLVLIVPIPIAAFTHLTLPHTTNNPSPKVELDSKETRFIKSKVKFYSKQFYDEQPTNISIKESKNNTYHVVLKFSDSSVSNSFVLLGSTDADNKLEFDYRPTTKKMSHSEIEKKNSIKILNAMSDTSDSNSSPETDLTLSEPLGLYFLKDGFDDYNKVNASIGANDKYLSEGELRYEIFQKFSVDQLQSDEFYQWVGGMKKNSEILTIHFWVDRPMDLETGTQYVDHAIDTDKIPASVVVTLILPDESSIYFSTRKSDKLMPDKKFNSELQYSLTDNPDQSSLGNE
jgi:hypothetical protein